MLAQVCTSDARTLLSANAFVNCRISTSFRLLAAPHRKKSEKRRVSCHLKRQLPGSSMLEPECGSEARLSPPRAF